MADDDLSSGMSSPGASELACQLCGEPAAKVATILLDCGHRHCTECLRRNATIALATNPFRPAKCCHVIPKETLERARALQAAELTSYDHKMEELTNPHRRIYCSNPDCGLFIPSANHGRRAAHCPNCGKRTCMSCDQKSHWGPCSRKLLRERRESENAVLKLAESKGWKRCPSCLNIVQKSEGCNNMT